MKRVLITGGSGFVGKNVVNVLLERGYEVYVISTSPTKSCSLQLKIVNCNLLNYTEILEVMQDISPSYLIHLAWETTHNIYLHSNKNIDWVTASMNLLTAFRNVGGKRVFISGTCFEYEYRNSPLSETDTLMPDNLYSACKIALHTMATQYSKDNGISLVWGRLFYLFGENEKPSRVVPYIISNLLKGNAITCKNSMAVRDFLYVKDAARIICDIFESNFEGDINIASGENIRMKELFEKISIILNCHDLVAYDNQPVTPEYIVASIEKQKLITNFNYSFEEGINNCIQFYNGGDLNVR